MGGPGKRKGKLSASSWANLLGYRILFGLAARLHPPRAVPLSPAPGGRVLVVSTGGIGDSLLDSAGIRALAESRPDLHIEAVVHHRRTDISRHNPFLKKLHLLKKGPLGFLALWRKLAHAGKWEAVLYFSCHDPEVRCLGYLLAPDATAGLAWRTEMPWLCARNIEEPGLRRAHLAFQAMRVAAEAGAEASRQAGMIYEVREEDRKALDQSLSVLGFPGHPGVVFQLGGGGGPHRDWPVEHFAELARLVREGGIGPLFILGGPDHSRKARDFSRLASELGTPFFDVVGRLPLAQSAALLERSRCVVSTDTGIMHLAFALGTPTVALLHCSPGDVRVGPLAGREKHRVIELSKPPGYSKPGDAQMRDISPQRVYPHLRDLFFRNG